MLVLGGALWFAWSLADHGARLTTVDVGVQTDRPGLDEAQAELVAVDAPGTAAGGARVAAPTEEGAVPRPGAAAPAADDPWILRGRVVDPTGAPVGDAFVALVSLHEGAPGNRGERAIAAADERGEFVLELPAWARETPVLCAARCQGWRPYSELIEIDPAHVEAEHELALAVGYEIAGRVVRDGAPVVDADVSINVAYGTGGVFDAGPESWWAEGRLEEKHGATRTAANGSFRITGMGPYGHRVQVHAHQHDVPRIAGHLFAITAPDSRVFDLTGARVAITVTGPDGPVSGAQVHVSSGEHGVMIESAEQPVIVEVPPDATIAFDVTHPLSRPVRTLFESSAPGRLHEVVVPLEIVTRPSLTVFVPGASRADIDGLRLRMQLINGFADTQLPADPTGAQDTFRVAVVPLDPGDYNLILEPDGSGRAADFVTPQTQEVTLPAEGELHVEFALQFSGRCDVRLSSASTDDWSAVYRVLDAEGVCCHEKRTFHSAPRQGIEWDEEIEWHGEISDSIGFRGGWKWSRSEDAGQVARRCGVLVAGAYTLEVESEGHEKWTGPITIEASRTTRVDVALTRAQ